MSLDIGRIGPSVVVDNPDAEVDIVLVHGLNGHPENTWTASNKNKTFWPTALLPESLQAVKARVIVYGYNADVYAFSRDAHATTDKIHEHAQSLLNNLQAYREDIGAQRRPIIWVAHSLGGILVKRTLNYSVSLTDPRLESSRDIYVATYGIIFLGTPHNGADKAKWGSILSSIGKAVFNKTGIVENSNNLIETLTSNSEVLQNINLDFNQLTSRFRMTLYHEEDPMPLIGIVVDQVSAGTLIPGCDYGGIAATHTGMTKFEKKGSPGYIPVSGKIRKYGQEAPDLIKQRWVVEDKARVQRRKDFANELDPTRETIPPPAPVSNNTENANTNGKGALQQLGAPAKHLAIEENPHTPPSRFTSPGREAFKPYDYEVEELDDALVSSRR
ncbi:MAG: hypothetical protein M1814_006066 [Vezdaea aestivalis]|nr:MAG: hypothetical protein M1814_006066 [Vezdaea aestivalis]